jgi:hypothetical protein
MPHGQVIESMIASCRTCPTNTITHTHLSLSDHQSYSSRREPFQIHFGPGYLYNESITKQVTRRHGLTIDQCLLNLILRGHHERSVLHDLLFEWLSRDLCVVALAHDILPKMRIIHTRMKSVLPSSAVTETPPSSPPADRTSVWNGLCVVFESPMVIFPFNAARHT